MRNGDTAGFLRVVCKIRLRVQIGVVADNLNRVFVRANRTVGAKTPELTRGVALCACVRRLNARQRQVRYIVFNCKGEALNRLCAVEVLSLIHISAESTVLCSNLTDITLLGFK